MKASSRSEIEQEIKISLSIKDMEAVFKVLSAETVKADIQHKYYPRAYFDTPELDLHAAGISLRVQYKPGKAGKLGHHEQTVKFELPAAGGKIRDALYRKECKDILPDAQPDMAAVSDVEAAGRLNPFKNKKLSHIFTAAIERRYFNIEAGKGKERGKAEVAFDVGEITLAGTGERQAFAEIEIEVKSGNPEIINKIRDRIFAVAPSAQIQADAKSVQGSKLYLAAKRSAGAAPRP